jgi:hypothetical protein
VKPLTRCAATTFVITAGFGLAGVGAATTADAQIGEFPSYHWDAGTCHDDRHRDIDGPDDAQSHCG